jgi:ribosomal protein L9
MKVKLLRQNRIDGNKGDIVEVSPARARFLFEVKLAEPVLARERVEVPEKKTAKTTRSKK